MTPWITGVATALAFAVLYVWAFRNLPLERWQIIASVPRKKMPDGSWTGLNLTFYGFFSATACVAGIALFLVLLGMIGVPVVGGFVFGAAIVAVGVIFSSLVNRWTAGNRFGFTVCGGAFVAILAAPFLILMMQHFGGLLPSSVGMLPVLAALVTAYAFGEGLGRLACISFGCCYGRRADRLPGWLEPLFRRWRFVFIGSAKKAAYEGRAEGLPLVPVQGMTVVLFTLATLVSVAFFVAGAYRTAFMVSLLTTQLWRVVSEWLRGDERENGRWRSYQVMAVAAATYGVLVGVVVEAGPAVAVDTLGGIRVLWNPGVLIALQIVWVAVFLRMGVSAVTGSRVSFFVRADRT
jgi:hypothetical protein